MPILSSYVFEILPICKWKYGQQYAYYIEGSLNNLIHPVDIYYYGVVWAFGYTTFKVIKHSKRAFLVLQVYSKS